MKFSKWLKGFFPGDSILVRDCNGEILYHGIVLEVNPNCFFIDCNVTYQDYDYESNTIIVIVDTFYCEQLSLFKED